MEPNVYKSHSDVPTDANLRIPEYIRRTADVTSLGLGSSDLTLRERYNLFKTFNFMLE